MSTSSFPLEGGAPAVAPPPRTWTLVRIIGFLSVSLFIATEIAAASGAGIWALSGLLGLGTAGTGVLAVLIGLPALYAIYQCTRLAIAAETDPVND